MASTEKSSLKDGLIYCLFDRSFECLKWTNPFEWSKCIGEWIYKLLGNSDPHKLIVYKRNAGDIYIILKWLYIFLLLFTESANSFLTFTVWYLIIANLFSFFYELMWKEPKGKIEKPQMRRRFLHLSQAIAYSHFSFAYLYRLPYLQGMKWEGDVTSLKAFWFSISNSVAGNYSKVSPLTEAADSVAMLQFLISFIFITVIIGKAIPSE